METHNLKRKKINDISGENIYSAFNQPTISIQNIIFTNQLEKTQSNNKVDER